MIGVELEAFVYENEEPVDVASWLKERGGRLKTKGASIITDAGRHSIELVSEPSLSVCGIGSSFAGALEQLPPTWDIRWVGEDVSPCQKLWAESKRYEKTLEALQVECPSGWQGVKNMNKWASFQMHLGGHPINDPKALLSMNFLNNLSPALAVIFANPRPSRRLKEAWFGWARPDRLPRYDQWFDRAYNLVSYVDKIPQLIENVGEDEWKILVRQTMNFGHPFKGLDVEKCLYWFCRPRPCLGTIEFRPIDSLPPVAAMIVADLILGLVDQYLRDHSSFKKVSERDWERLIEEQDPELALHYLPQLRPTFEEWPQLLAA